MACFQPDAVPGSDVWLLPPLLAELFADGETELVLELMETFLTDTGQRIQALQEDWSRGDLAAVRSESHSLKGSCGQMGAPLMVQICQTMETLARDGKALEGQALVGRLAAELTSVRSAFQRYQPGRQGILRDAPCGS